MSKRIRICGEWYTVMTSDKQRETKCTKQIESVEQTQLLVLTE